MGRVVAFLIIIGLMAGAGWWYVDRHGMPEQIQSLLSPSGTDTHDTEADSGSQEQPAPRDPIPSQETAPSQETTVDQGPEQSTRPLAASPGATRTGDCPEPEGLVRGRANNPVVINPDTANADRRINDEAITIIKESEALRLEVYKLGRWWFVGYGHLIRDGDPLCVTQAEALAILRKDVEIAEEGVRQALTQRATVNQFSAMVSLAFNIGTGAFKGSQVAAKFNAGDIVGAADAFLTYNTWQGDVVDKLTRRRMEERALFLK